MLIDNYTDRTMSFFEKLDRIQEALDGLAVYPRGVQDSSSPNKTQPWPFLAASPYPEVDLNQHYDAMFKRGSMLLQNAYPYILDSYAFPQTISSAARKLSPDCEIKRDDLHYLIHVTNNGQTKSYGGSGRGRPTPIYSKHLDSLFTFDKSKNDWFTTGTLNSYYEKLVSYHTIAEADAEQYQDLIAGDTFRQTIGNTGGTWIRIGKEGSSRAAFAYEILANYTVNGYRACRYLSDTWVDGRYINNFEIFEEGATFSEHPNASIVVSKMHYTNVYGKTYTEDVLFTYDASEDNWKAISAYGSSRDLPREFILTREQVESMNIDANTDIVPSSGLIYDGTAFPGTPFGTVGENKYIIAISASPSTGGSVTGGGSYDGGESVIVKAVSNNGYHFVGWTESGTMVSTSTTYEFTAKTNRTLTAAFELETELATYTITYDASGGTVKPTTATTDTDGRLSTVPTPTRDGYIFGGWYTAVDGGEKVDESKVYTENTTLYAHWTESTDQSGDLTGDGKVTMADVIRLARGAAGYVTLTEQEKTAGDVNGDGKITMADVIRVARYAAGYSTSL